MVTAKKYVNLSPGGYGCAAAARCSRSTASAIASPQQNPDSTSETQCTVQAMMADISATHATPTATSQPCRGGPPTTATTSAVAERVCPLAGSKVRVRHSSWRTAGETEAHEGQPVTTRYESALWPGGPISRYHQPVDVSSSGAVRLLRQSVGSSVSGGAQCHQRDCSHKVRVRAAGLTRGDLQAPHVRAHAGDAEVLVHVRRMLPTRDRLEQRHVDHADHHHARHRDGPGP